MNATEERLNNHHPDLRYQGFSFDKRRLTIETNQGEIWVSILTQNAIEVLYIAKEDLPSVSTVRKSLSFFRPTKDTTISSSANELTMTTSAMNVVIDKHTLLMSWYDKVGKCLTSQTCVKQHKSPGFGFTLCGQEKLFEFGGAKSDQRGNVLVSNHSPYCDTCESRYSGSCLPSVTSDRAYQLIFDSQANYQIDCGKTDADQLWFEADSGRPAFIFIMSDDVSSLSRHVFDITDTLPMFRHNASLQAANMDSIATAQ